jgi:hypothetical protein
MKPGPARIFAFFAPDRRDIGSTGLRMLPATVPVSAYAISNRPSVYGYGSGVRPMSPAMNTATTQNSSMP